MNTVDGQRTVTALVAGQVARAPGRVAVSCDGRGLTYGELGTMAGRLAAVLRRHGVGPERLAGVCVPRSAELPVVLLAILRAGGAYLPLDPGYPAARLRFMIEDARPAVVVTTAKARSVLPAVPGTTVLLLEELLRDTQATITATVHEDGLAYVMYTSGSTGTPRAVAVPHRAIANLVRADYAESGPGEVFLHAAPLSFDASTFEIWGALANGARLAILPDGRPGPGPIAETILAEGVTTAWLTASLFHLMVREHPGGLRPLRQLLAGGDVLSESLVREAIRVLPGCRIVNGYGPTEATTFSTCHRLDGDLFSGPVPIGTPITGTTAYVLDESLNRRPVGVAGELYVAGAGLSRGYHGDPASTAARFVPDPFGEPGSRLYRTGDRALLRPDGCLEFLGRLDDQVKIRGFRIELGSVVAALRSHPAVTEAVVTTTADPAGDRRLSGYVTIRRGSAVTGPELRRHLSGRLPGFEVPATITVLDRLPMTANGKVDRDALPAPVTGTTGRAPATPAEERVTSLLAEILGTAEVPADAGFFELGVDSVQLMRLAARLGTVSLGEVFDAGSVAALARRLPPHGGVEESIPLVATGGPAPLSAAQERLWILDQLGDGGAAYVVPMVYRLCGPLSVDALVRAFAEVVARHEPLRTVFTTADGVPVQRVLDPPGTVVRTIDLSGLPPAERGRRSDSLLEEVLTAPFDLAGGPVFRALLVKLGPREYVLACSAHHIAVDGWSLGVLRAELSAAYRAHAEGRVSPLPALSPTYRDFAHWDRARRDESKSAALVEYWRKTLDGAPALRLHTDFPRPATLSHRGGSAELDLPAGLTADLRRAAAEHGTTVYLTALAAFQVLLARYSGQLDFCVGLPVAGRDRPELEPLIGFFVNTVVFRASLAGDPAFTELLARTKETALAAFTHQELPFERLVDALGVPRAADRNPLVQVFFAGQNTPGGELELPGIEVSRVRPHSAGIQFDLALSLEELPEGALRCVAEYSEDLFSADTVRRFVRHFETVLGAAVRAPGTPISGLSPLTARERAEAGRRGPAAPCAGQSVHELVARQAALRPDAIALSYGDHQVTYGELETRASRVARQLIGLGAGPERLVGVCATRCLELPLMLLAVLKTGGSYLPLDPALPPARLRDLIGDTSPAAVLSIRAAGVTVPGTVFLEDLEAGPDVAVSPPRRAHPDALAYVMYTSGSTGRPKGVAVTHRGVLRLVTDPSWLPLGPEQVLFQQSPPSFDMATLEIWGALANGARLAVFPPGADPVTDTVEEVRAAGVTTLLLSTPLFHEIIRGGFDGLGRLRALLVGGDVLSPEDARHAVAGLPDCRIFNIYGPTEATTLSTVYPIGAEVPSPVPIGEPVAGFEAYVLDRWYDPVPPGVPGELFLGGPALARGYLGQPAVTAAAFVPNPFGEPGSRLYRTGDRVRFVPGGTLEFLGRADHQVKIRGFRVEIEEVEAALRGHRDVREAVVTVLGDEQATRRLVASVVGGVPAGTGVRDRLAARLPAYMVPSRISVVDELPRTPAGKPDRRAVALLEAALDAAAPVANTPLDDVEAKVAEVWGEVLCTALTDARVNFFDAGGNSLLLARVRSRLLDRFGRDVPLVELLRHPTVAALAAYLRDGRSGPAPRRPEGARARMNRQRALRSAGTAD